MHHTDLICTYSRHNDGLDYLDHLEKELLRRGYKLNKRPTEEVYKKLVDSEENKYITRLTLLICTFINNFKTQGYSAEKFDDFKVTSKNVRTNCSRCL